MADCENIDVDILEQTIQAEIVEQNVHADVTEDHLDINLGDEHLDVNIIRETLNAEIGGAYVVYNQTDPVEYTALINNGETKDIVNLDATIYGTIEYLIRVKDGVTTSAFSSKIVAQYNESAVMYVHYAMLGVKTVDLFVELDGD